MTTSTPEIHYEPSRHTIEGRLPLPGAAAARVDIGARTVTRP
jgi:hypothetical protein